MVVPVKFVVVVVVAEVVEIVLAPVVAKTKCSCISLFQIGKYVLPSNGKLVFN